MGVSQFYIVYCWVHYDLFSPKIWYFLLFFSCSPSSQHQLVFVYCINVYLFHYHPNQSMWAELSGENFRSPLTWVFAPSAPPLKVGPDRSTQFRSSTISSRSGWNRSTLAQILNYSAYMPKTCRFQPKPYAWDTLSAWQTWSGFVAWLLRKKIRFTSILSWSRGCGVVGPHLIRAYSAGNVAALIC